MKKSVVGTAPTTQMVSGPSDANMGGTWKMNSRIGTWMVNSPNPKSMLPWSLR